MELSPQGFLRPHVPLESGCDATLIKKFRTVCPGIRLHAPKIGERYHAVFGGYIEAWQAHATEPEVRLAGGSGGVLTALSTWLVETGRSEFVVASASAPSGSRTVPVQIVSKAEALRAAGSRYAPVSNLEIVDVHAGPQAFVGKPCEASAAHELINFEIGTEARPLILSFFCAGVPSQNSTHDLIQQLGMSIEEVASVRYRGNGWPGRFVVTGQNGTTESLSYHESWGLHLGRNIQSRCKICPDGVGRHADIVVGDYWQADNFGYPKFEEGEGNSVLIARTPRGKAVVSEAAIAGVLTLCPVDLDLVAEMQPLQVERVKGLLGRLCGRVLLGHRIPVYRGYGLLGHALRHPVRAVRACIGTIIRGVAEAERNTDLPADERLS